MRQKISMLLVLLGLSLALQAQTKTKHDVHKTIVELDFSFKLHQQAKNKQNQTVNVINPVNNFFGFRYTNAFFIKRDLSVGIGIGLEMAPVIEFPFVLDIRKYFGKKANKNYLSCNIGKAFNGYSGFKTWLGEVGFGRNIKIGKKTSLNLSTNYQLTYLKAGKVDKTDYTNNWVKDFYTSSLAIKVGLMF